MSDTVKVDLSTQAQVQPDVVDAQVADLVVYPVVTTPDPVV